MLSFDGSQYSADQANLATVIRSLVEAVVELTNCTLCSNTRPQDTRLYMIVENLPGVHKE